MVARVFLNLFVAIAVAVGSSGCCRGGGSSEAASTEATSDTWHKLLPSSGALAVQVAAEVVKAKALNLKPIVYIGATWCDPCRAIHRYRLDPKMVDAFQRTYVIELDLDEWKAEELTAMGYETGSIPVFIAIDGAGKATGPKIDGGAWGDNIPVNMAPPLKEFFAGLS